MKELEYYGEKFYAKTCPCCGGDPRLEAVNGNGIVFRVYLECNNCGLRTKNIPVAPHYSAIAVAVDFWNKREDE